MIMAKTATAWDDTLRILNIIGLYSSTNSKKRIVLSLYYLIQLIYLLLVVLIQFPNIDGDALKIANNLEALCAFTQHFAKVAIMLCNQESFIKLLEKTKLFWKTDVIVHHYMKIKLDNMPVIAKKLERLFICAAGLTGLGVTIYSLKERKLPTGVWTFKEYNFFFYFTQISQMVSITFAGSGIVLYDCVFFATCIQTIIQFKILAYCLSNLSLPEMASEEDENEYFDKLKLYIKQHNFLLGFLKDLQNYYSPAFLTQCLTTAPLIGTEMYAILAINNPNEKNMHFIYCFAMILQLTFYCITVDSVSGEALLVGQAMYNSDWYTKLSPKLGKRMVILMQKSQQPVVFTAGGLFEIKSTTVLTVLRVSWSACTVMRNLKRK